eukprot:s2398_g3.t1
MSSTAAALCSEVSVHEVFQDHATVSVKLNMEIAASSIQTWPKPKEIPWDQVQIQEWHASCDTTNLTFTSDATTTMCNFAKAFEQSLNHHVDDLPHSSLSSAHCGRAQRLMPAHLSPTPRSCRASRPGEETIASDSLCKVVILWFKQLRRLQSYLHSIRAGQQHASAIQHRVELWTAIRRSKGFGTSFTTWWGQQDFAMTLGPFPFLPPDAEAASLIFQAYHHQFRSFEQWHMAQRQKILQAKYDKTMKALFQDLRRPGHDQVDSFWETTPYEVIAIRPETQAVLLHQPITDQKEGQWFLHGKPVQIQGHLEEMIVFDPMPDLAVGDVLDFHHHTATTDQVHQCLIDFWQPRWNCREPMTAEVWQRVLNFATQFLPRLHLQLPALNIADWRRAVRRFRPRAAKGADGWAKLDLVHMPDVYVEHLLTLLTQIEQAQSEWPAQLLEGMVIAIAKCDGAHRPNEFRPIVLLSLIYRTWASLRSRQLLRMLEPFIHSDAHGFLPSREPAQTWLLIQAAVEVALQSGQTLAGVGTDFIKAFNSIRRESLWVLAAAIGIPDTLLHPWKTFTTSFTRRFLVNNQVSPPVTSNQGFAEGCPLSVCAMALVDWGFQLYQYHYVPQVRHLSFVDNITMMAQAAPLVAWAFFTLRTFLTMWGLELDLTKTYTWGTTSLARQQLAQLGVQVVTDFSELGGALTFTAAHRVRCFLKKGESLFGKWQQLRRSKAPISMKIAALPIVFWAKALHGTLSCVAADHHVHKLRTQAIKSLGLQLAGSNPMLRLSLSTPMTADPGFFQLRSAVFDFRRLCSKSPDLLVYWRIYMARYDGKLRDGPFAKLLTLFGNIGWQILQPPLFTDHDGFVFDLFAISVGALEILLRDAWFQHVATAVHHKTMADLSGLDVSLTLLDHHKLPAGDLGRVKALQSGAFVSAWQHAKFDKTKQPVCQHCLVPDTQKHWLRCPRFAAQRLDSGPLHTWLSDAPDCVALHLLAPRSPYLVPLKRYFLELPDRSRIFLSSPRQGMINQVFTDGSFFKGCVPQLNRASWAVVSATTGECISHGGVPGLHQTIGRAELWAIISATAWSLTHDVQVIIWTDSSGTCSKAQRLLSTPNGPLPEGDNADLWKIFAELLAQTKEDQICVRWIPSHVDQTLRESTTEEFLAAWNDVADHHAVRCNEARGSHFQHLFEQAERYYLTWAERLTQLRAFYLKVAQTRQDIPEVLDLTDEQTDVMTQHLDMSLGDALPVNWQLLLRQHSADFKCPCEFIFTLIQSCIDFEPMQTQFEAVSFVEVAMWVVQDLGAQFPTEKTTSGQWRFRRISDMLLRPTVAFLTQRVKQSFIEGLTALGLECFICRGISRPQAGIAIPIDGVFLSVSHEFSSRLCAISNSFFGPRMLRKAADMARPLM